MKLRKIRILLMLSAVFSLMSCASSPKSAPAASGPVLPDSLVKARKAADDSRAKALEIKANVAAKAVFDQGESGYAAAAALSDKAEYDKAASGFSESDSLFKKALEEATQKRKAALESLGKADTDRKTAEQALVDAANAEKGELN